MEMEVIKEALESGAASASTVASLKCFLSSDGAPTVAKPQQVRRSAESKKPRAARNARTATAKAKRTQVVEIREDAPTTVSAREKYALAKDTANACIKILSEAPKRRPTSPRTTSCTNPGASLKPLEPRSGNSTPNRPSLDRLKAASGTSPIVPPNGPTSHVVAAAECARLAFSYLRSADPQTFGSASWPKLQLETGMLALVGRMIAHGLDAMAVGELRMVKRRLEALPTLQGSGIPAKAADVSVERETLSSLLHLNVCFDWHPEALPLAITYNFHVLKLICASRRPAVIEAALQHLSIEKANSPVDLIIQHSKSSGQVSKAARQLEVLSEIIFSACPSVASAADEVARDPKQWPLPSTVLKLQILALRIRKLWWTLAGHHADVTTELLKPLLRCATAFVSRYDGRDAYDLLAGFYDALGPFDSDAAAPTLFRIHSLLCVQAERAGKYKVAQQWIEELVRDCSLLNTDHARRVASLVQRATFSIEHPHVDGEQVDIGPISDLLKNSFTGESADQEVVIISLAGLTRAFGACRRNVDLNSAIHTASLAAACALRYSRSYPGENSKHVQAIIDAALRLGRSVDDILSWVSEDAAKAFIHAGILQAVGDAADTQPLSGAWAISSAATSLSRIVHALVIRSARSSSKGDTTLIFDNEQLEPTQRGSLLEMQLKYALDLAPKAKYHGGLRKLIPAVLQRLAKCYGATEFPIRRARISTIAFRVREYYPDMLPPHIFQVWQNDFVVDEDELGHDAELRRFCGDVKAGLNVAKAFSNGRPTLDDLKPSLLIWQRIVDGCRTRQAICDKIEHAPALIQMLEAVAAYFRMLGEDATCLAVQKMLMKLTEVYDDNPSTACLTLLDLVKQYLESGYSEKAGQALAKAKIMLQTKNCSHFAQLQYQLGYADYLLAIDNVGKCHAALEEARTIATHCISESVARDERKPNELLLYAQVWLVQSKHAFEIGSPHDALAAARHSVRVLNKIWTGLEQSHGNQKVETLLDNSETLPSDLNTLTIGVSKLNLANKTPVQTAGMIENKKGAAFWSVAPILSKALLHLSDMYTHHGIFNEANFYCESATSIAESVGSSLLLSRIKSHKCWLFTLAGKIQPAELCLAQDNAADSSEISLAVVDRLCARASLREKEDTLEEAVGLYEKAERIVDRLDNEAFRRKIERFGGDVDDLEEQTALLSLEQTAVKKSATKASEPQAIVKVVKKSGKKADSKPTINGIPKSQPKARAVNSVQLADICQDCTIMKKLKAEILLRKALVAVRLGRDVEPALAKAKELGLSRSSLIYQRHALHQVAMRKAVAAIEAEVTLNVLAESTLSFPAVVDPNLLRLNVSTTKNAKKKTTAERQLGELLNAARDCLLNGQSSSLQFSGTAQTHSEFAMLSASTLLLCAIPNSQPLEALQPINEGLTIDLPRIKALQYEQKAIIVDSSCIQASELLIWPKCTEEPSYEVMTEIEFQKDFVSILPKSWTAVSLCLSEDNSELYIARYRSGQSPLILKLPFSRQKAEDLDEESFNYHKGKAELDEIIGLSNYSCHNASDMDRKGAKTNWWSEREALDRRLHELLINIENIWLGGFKGILSPHRGPEDLLPRFRKSFEDILDRFLPSRQASKARCQRLVLDDKVLELFTSLGDDGDGTIDLDEPLTDLLYFIVDMLQFSGERNAYDEIDFDGMAVDVLDALRAYHDGCGSRDANTQHLILVLDRRLQAFPWESMPCLEGARVSRVGSLLSLRERIIALRTGQDESSTKGMPNGGDDCHVVPRASGTYILNPSSDLPKTQATLEPTLSTLSKTDGARWSGIVNERPDENSFTAALTQSSMLLYFGHGGGLQYIRARTIKRLERCSEVIWLMGCSSGAVSEYGGLEPSATPLTYLLAGQHQETESRVDADARPPGSKCMAVVATLWDVTDKDIDRFSLAAGEEWGLWPASEQNKLPTKTPRKRQVVAAPTTPQQVPKTPKVPKVLKTPAPAKTPARDRGRTPRDNDKKLSLVEAVARSREACYLRYLNGAAPVVYGVPVYLGD